MERNLILNYKGKEKEITSPRSFEELKREFISIFNEDRTKNFNFILEDINKDKDILREDIFFFQQISLIKKIYVYPINIGNFNNFESVSETINPIIELKLELENVKKKAKT